MPRIPEHIVEQIREAAADHIVDIVSNYVTGLKRSGVRYTCCCPFHTEKTPSFSVSPAKGLFYCYGCHKGGDAVKFIMEMDHISYPEALRILANKYNITIPEAELSPEEKQAAREREGLLNLMEYAAKTYEANLRETEEGQAEGLAYLRSRGFRDDTIATFHLGYAPKGGNSLTAKATSENWKEDQLCRDALTCVDTETGEVCDYFRGRVIFPILDSSTSGKVTGFAGRETSDEASAESKYLMTPNTEIFWRGTTLFGLKQASQHIDKEKRCFLVQGFTDVISMHQSGIANTVATCGTELTSRQLQLIKRRATKLTIVISSDTPAETVIDRIDTALREGLSVKVLRMPEGEDPDSFARKHTAEEIKAYIKSKEVNFVRFEVEALSVSGIDDPQVKTILNSITCLQDSISREIYAQELATLTYADEGKVLNMVSEHGNQQ